MWRSTMSYGRMGVVINAISAVDLALVGHRRKSAQHAGLQAARRRNQAAAAGLLHGQRHRAARRVRVQAPEAGDSARPRRWARRHAQERRARAARAQGARARRRHHAGLLDGVDGALHDRNRRDDGAVSGVLDGRVPAAARLRRVRPACGSDHEHPHRHRRARIHAIRLPAAARDMA